MTYDDFNDLLYELYNDNHNEEGDYEVVVEVGKDRKHYKIFGARLDRTNKRMIVSLYKTSITIDEN